MAPNALVPVADGTEEIEAVCIVDVLRRAGAHVTVASVSETLQIEASRGIKIVADAMIQECKDKVYDLIALPGGMPGAEHLRDSIILSGMLKDQQQAGRWYAAICASPAVVLAHHGLIGKKSATCHPVFSSQLPNPEKSESRVVIDGSCITSRGPGTALEFALQLVAVLFDENKVAEVAGPMIMHD